MIKYKKKHLSSSQIIALGFLCVIFIGCLLLMLPFATQDRRGASFLEALFTAVSSVCVTGLVVQDTATYWSLFGQVVIISLIQIGGMGVVTLVVSITMLSGKKIGLMQRSTMQEAISAPDMQGIVKLTHFIIKVSITTEILGAAIMSPVFINKFGFLKGLWYAVFHSVSAFCNAGFDLMGVETNYSSLTGFAGHPVMNLIIMGLIIWGGLGFLTWDDIFRNKWKIKRYRMQSKVILVTTAVLIIFPALYFYFFEFSGNIWNHMTTGEHILASLFQSVTPRTAGFNTVDLQNLNGPGKVITIILMLIGGSPGSTAGGVKTTTVAVLAASTIAVFSKSDDVHYFGRRIPTETVHTASAILMMYTCLFLTGSITISMLENLPVLDCMFETASAIGTVGLTLGITPDLSMVSRMILICLMYMGRVGGLTLVFAATSGQRRREYSYPQEKITVG